MKYLMKLLCQSKLLVLLLLIAISGRALIILVMNYNYANIINAVFASDNAEIKRSSLTLLGVAMLQAALVFTFSRLSDIIAERAGHKIRIDTVEQILRIKYGKLAEIHSGERISILNNDMSGILEWIRSHLSEGILDMVVFSAVLTSMLYINWKLTIISFSAVPVILLYSFCVSKPIANTEKHRQEALSDANVLVKSVIDAFPLVKIYMMSKPLINKANSAIDTSVKMEQNTLKTRTLLMNMNLFITFIPLGLIFAFGTLMVTNGEMSAGVLLAYINMSNYIMNPLLSIPERLGGIRRMLVNLNRVNEVLICEVNEQNNTGDENIMNGIIKNAFEFSNVCFGYLENQPVIHNISFALPVGKRIAIIGESGCGKSTLIKLLAGLYLPSAGDITVLGASTRDWPLQALRLQIAVVTQEAQLFPVSIYENITCGHEMSMDCVLEACKAAHLEELIASLPNGIYTEVGEHGSRLSGGQRQRICIARAIARNAPVLLLDEATSALDVHTEKEIGEALHTLMTGRSILIVTHRIQSAATADKIICIKDGQIIEEGTHEELMKLNSYYSGLYNIQCVAGA